MTYNFNGGQFYETPLDQSQDFVNGNSAGNNWNYSGLGTEIDDSFEELCMQISQKPKLIFWIS